jgi:hypothetical protein
MADASSTTRIPTGEPQHVVRTYASDMAALAAQGAADDGSVSAPASPAPAASTAAPIHEDIVADESADAAAQPPPAPAPQTPAPAPVASAPMPAPAPEPAIHAERQSILDRLRARADARPAEPAAPLASRMSLGAGVIGSVASVEPSEEQLPSYELPTALQAPEPAAAYASPAPVQPHPSLQMIPQEPVLPVPPAYAPPAVPAYASAPQPPPAAPSPIHTYTSDFADRVDARGATAFSVLAAQQDAAPRALPVIAAKRSRLPLILSIAGVLLIILGGAGAFYAYSITHKPPVQIIAGVSSLIPFDDKAELSGAGSALMSQIAQSAATALPEGEVRVLYTATATTTAAGTNSIPNTGGALIAALMLPAPDILLRNIAPASTVGIVDAQNETRAFFILQVTSYDATFRGMLSWEPTMAHDLSMLYPAFPAGSTQADSADASTSTVVIAPSATAAAGQFSDEVVSNHDVRALKDASGRTLMLYGYYDESTLVIARNEAAFAELLGRLGSGGQ